jgi:hypothetical protein
MSTPVLPVLIETLGWVATAVFVGSYFFTRAEVLVRVQMAGAVLWVAYGLLLGATPVVVANVLVLSAAAWKGLRARRAAAVPVPVREPELARWRPLDPARRDRA